MASRLRNQRTILPCNWKVCGLFSLSAAMLCGRVAAQNPETVRVVAEGRIEQAAVELFPIDARAPIRRVEVGVRSTGVAANGQEPPAERLVYSNTLGLTSFAPGMNVRVADDIVTTAAPGCPLTRFEFMVNTRVNPALAGGPVTVSWALYNICPGAVPAEVLENYLVLNDVSEGSVQLTEDGLHDVAVTLSESVATNGSFWLSLIFSRANAGPVGGAPATDGHSDDRYHHTGSVSCGVNFGSFPPQPHGSFHVQFWSEDCAASTPSYRATRETGPLFSPGSNHWVVDNLELVGGTCNLVGYEVAIQGAGTYSLEFRETCAGPAIPGTEHVRIAEASNPNRRIQRFSVNPPIALSQSVWFAAKVNNATARFITSGWEPAIGDTDDSFGLQAPGATTCTTVDALQGNHDALHLIVYCEGEAPLGACCDPYLLECRDGDSDGLRCNTSADCTAPGTCDSVCRELPQYACWFPPRGGEATTDWAPPWQAQQTCSPHPFEPACGKWACCKPDDTCENLTEEDCEAVPPLDRPRLWQIGSYCGEGLQTCPFNACLAAQDHCGLVQSNPGCKQFECCEATCAHDLWCCTAEWDPFCVRRNLSCPGNGWSSSCNAAVLLVPGQSVEGSNLHSVGSEPASCFPPTSLNRADKPLWFKFVAPSEIVRLQTCNTSPPHNDTMMAVYAVQDSSTPQASCSSRSEVACVYDSPTCGNGGGVEMCLTDLMPGHTYLVQVAAPRRATPSLIRIDMETGCNSMQPESRQQLQSTRQEPLATCGGTPVEFPVAATGSARIDPKLVDDASRARSMRTDVAASGAFAWSRGSVASLQVNVNATGSNIPGDAANQPSMAVDTTFPNLIVIGWRQFSTLEAQFPEAGWAYSHNGGLTWNFPGVLEPGVFRSDPSVSVDSSGHFHYLSRAGSASACDLFTSFDGGVTWLRGQRVLGGEKPWMVSDPASAAQTGRLYASCQRFTRSFSSGDFFEHPVFNPPEFGTMAVGPDLELYLAGRAFEIYKAINAHIPTEVVDFEPLQTRYYGPSGTVGPPNPSGLLGRTWVVVNCSAGPARGNVYAIGTAAPELDFPTDVVFTRSTDSGVCWSTPVPVHPNTDGWQWFGTMSIAPNGRLDVFWNDTQPTGQVNLCELRYSYSLDGGSNWSKPLAVSPVFDSWVGWPNQDKIGDYYHSVSDDLGVSLAYAATFNGEQDIYFLRIGGQEDCNKNGFPDVSDVAEERSADCNQNGFPDECEADFDGDELIDECDPDMDNDGILNEADRCDHTGPGQFDSEGHHLADTNRNCWLDLADFWRLRNCMQGGRPGMPTPQAACLAAFDRNGDELTDLADFAVFQNEYGASRP